MPHTTVEYTGSVADAFDRAAFGKDPHAALVTIAGGRAAGRKTRFVRLDDTYIGDGSPHHAMVHAEIAVLAGPTTPTKRELTDAVLALLREYTAPTPGFELQFSVAQRDFDPDTYVMYTEPRVAE